MRSIILLPKIYMELHAQAHGHSGTHQPTQLWIELNNHDQTEPVGDDNTILEHGLREQYLPWSE